MQKHQLALRPHVRGADRCAVLALFTAALLGATDVGRACDLCAIYTATELRESRIGLRLGVAEQFTRVATLQRSGEEIDNAAGERLDSSITQILLGYNLTRRIGLQLNIPIITRHFRRVEGANLVRDSETGFGDLSLIGNLVAYRTAGETSVFRFSILGGLKLPSGDSGRLREELSGDDEDGMDGEGESFRSGRWRAAEHGDDHSAHASGIHGHDLALGSGSTDGVIGSQLFWSWRRLFVSGSLQYLLHTRGEFDYEYANHLLWTAGPGLFLLAGHSLGGRDFTLGAATVLSGESKGTDTRDDLKVGDTAYTSLYVGPGFNFTWGTSLGVEVNADLPVLQNNSGLQIVPDYRLRGGVTWRF